MIINKQAYCTLKSLKEKCQMPHLIVVILWRIKKRISTNAPFKAFIRKVPSMKFEDKLLQNIHVIDGSENWLLNFKVWKAAFIFCYA